jgi:hypothetical protein
MLYLLPIAAYFLLVHGKKSVIWNTAANVINRKVSFCASEKVKIAWPLSTDMENCTVTRHFSCWFFFLVIFIWMLLGKYTIFVKSSFKHKKSSYPVLFKKIVSLLWNNVALTVFGNTYYVTTIVITIIIMNFINYSIYYMYYYCTNHKGHW